MPIDILSCDFTDLLMQAKNGFTHKLPSPPLDTPLLMCLAAPNKVLILLRDISKFYFLYKKVLSLHLQAVDWEVELAIVIGKHGSHIKVQVHLFLSFFQFLRIFL